MRITKKQLHAIKTNFTSFFHDGQIYLFGSRVDNARKGGDIDLYISTTNKDDLVYKKVQFLTHLKREIGQQKVDVVLDYGQDRLIDKVAKKDGVLL